MANVLPFEFIAQKQAGKAHTPDAIRHFIQEFMSGNIPDYQMSAWLMAVYFKGMNEAETEALTSAMIDTGVRVHHEHVHIPLGDKHSTGGVGDKITMLLAPLVSAAGLAVPTVTGRGLGFTGGTLDKLESIPGMRTDLSVKDLTEQVAKVGLAFGAQTDEIVPADKRIYALRDVTSTVRSFPLITSSIISKKSAEGIDAIVFDVKCGRGAFMETYDDALELSRWLVRIARRFEIRAAALVTSMDAPLGSAVGNWLEIAECVNALRGKSIEPDIRELTLALGGTLLALTGKSDTPDMGWRTLDTLWTSGKGFQRFRETVQMQGGDTSVFQDGADPHKPGGTYTLKADREGFINAIEAREIGFSAIGLGAGRRKTDDAIDPAAGFIFHRHLGDEVTPGEPLVTLAADSEERCLDLVDRVKAAIRISDDTPNIPPLIRRVVTAEGEFSWDDFRGTKLNR